MFFSYNHRSMEDSSDLDVSRGLGRHSKPKVVLVPNMFMISLSIVICFITARSVAFYSLYRKNDTPIIIILGGGLTSTGDVPTWTQIRLNEAVELFHAMKKTPILITLSGGTPHKPNPVDDKRFPIWEATAAAKKLIEMGVPACNVYEEALSLDTIGNAFFLRSIHIDPGKYHRLYIITNDWHMPRAKTIFEKVFSLPASTTLFSTYLPSWIRNYVSLDSYELKFVPVASGIDDEKILQVRIGREGKSLQSFLKGPSTAWRSFEDVYHFIFTSHTAYATSRFKNPSAGISAEELKTY